MKNPFQKPDDLAVHKPKKSGKGMSLHEFQAELLKQKPPEESGKKEMDEAAEREQRAETEKNEKKVRNFLTIGDLGAAAFYVNLKKLGENFTLSPEVQAKAKELVSEYVSDEDKGPDILSAAQAFQLPKDFLDIPEIRTSAMKAFINQIKAGNSEILQYAKALHFPEESLHSQELKEAVKERLFDFVRNDEGRSMYIGPHPIEIAEYFGYDDILDSAEFLDEAKKAEARGVSYPARMLSERLAKKKNQR